MLIESTIALLNNLKKKIKKPTARSRLTNLGFTSLFHSRFRAIDQLWENTNYVLRLEKKKINNQIVLAITNY